MPNTGNRRLHIVHTESSLGWGGQEIRILTEAEGMIRRGHQVTLLCPPEAKIYAEAGLRNIAVTGLPMARKNLRGVYALFRWLKANPMAVVNTHSSTDSWLVALATQCFKKAPPIVRTRHISPAIANNIPTRWLYTKAARHIVTTGENLRQQLITDNGYPAQHITSVPTGIDMNYFVPGDVVQARKRLGLAQDGYIIGILATLRSWKGHRYLLEAFAQLTDKNIRLMIVGDGPQREALQQKIAELNIGNRVVMPGNQRDVLPWLQAMDIFVLPSYANEGVPQAILQAMACGLPVITTPVGSITEVVEHEVTGLITEPQQVQPLLETMYRLLEDTRLRHTLGSNAHHLAQQKFGLDIMLDKMELIFDKVAAGHTFTLVSCKSHS